MVKERKICSVSQEFPYKEGYLSRRAREESERNSSNVAYSLSEEQLTDSALLLLFLEIKFRMRGDGLQLCQGSSGWLLGKKYSQKEW